MNVNSGGPHLLLFERDQQLTALLTSEFQLAGYECHAARTAVEVFDAIARYPIRLVLVNLAQAAAGRREFWVALDAQRRGRGVQVFTFRCMNLAGYGADDPDERARTVLADMEVDGMLGVMNLVDAVRARIPGSTTGSSFRIPAAPVASKQAGTREAASAPHVAVTSSASITGQVTSPLPTLASNGTATPSASSPQPVSSPTLQRPQPSAPRLPVPQAGLPTSSMPASPTVAPSAPSPSPGPSVPTTPPSPTGPDNTPSGFTDKIRAVIYPSSRNFSQVPVGQETTGSTAFQAGLLQNQPSANSSGDETGLEQLSRMVREQGVPAQEGAQAEQREQRDVGAPLAETVSGGQVTTQSRPSGMQETLSGGQAMQPLADSPPISAMSLRASPIQDIAIERGTGELASGGTSRQIVSQQAEPSGGVMSAARGAPINSFAPPPEASSHTHPTAFVPPSTPAMPPTPVPAPVSPPTAVSTPNSPIVEATLAGRRLGNDVAPPTPAPKSAPVSMSAPTPAPALSPTPIEPENEDVGAPLVGTHEDEPSSSFTGDKPSNGLATPRVATVGSDLSRPAPIYRPEESPIARTLVGTPLADALKASVQSVIRRNETGTSASTDETLLNIVQSFPPMPSPSQSPQEAQQSQPPVLSGRATRSLGSVLLEGHLVPQHRLEVAQHIQRMLRGVDMNYQLGEILLMFKLLTPDQLLAASLVSYGLISTMQISALGRIRQELHAIGLEYDLESLLVLFRILSPEQLREVRASWSA